MAVAKQDQIILGLATAAVAWHELNDFQELMISDLGLNEALISCNSVNSFNIELLNGDIYF